MANFGALKKELRKSITGSSDIKLRDFLKEQVDGVKPPQSGGGYPQSAGQQSYTGGYPSGVVQGIVVPPHQHQQPQQVQAVPVTNDEGAHVQLGADGRTHYCGRHLGKAAIPGSDGRCGPTNGPQCQSCRRLQSGHSSHGGMPHHHHHGHVHAMPAAVAASSAPSFRGGKKRALLVGINYTGTRAKLRGCINDVKNMKSMLTQTFGWDHHSIRTLTDDGGEQPTRANIMAGLRWLAQGAQAGDSLIFHFSGHGAQQRDPEGLEEDGMNETILPVDFQRAGMITDDEISDIIVRPLPEGVRVTGVMDCCHSGTGMDLPFTWSKTKGWKEEVNPYHSQCDAVLFSGCEDHDVSADSSRYGQAGGAMTTAFCDVLRSNPTLPYSTLMTELAKVMRARGFRQRPQLSSSQRFGADRMFTLTDAVPNGNAKLGRTVRRRFPPRPRKMKGPLADLLPIGIGLAGGLIAADIIGGLLF
mmetsp:Transcript_48974/g.116463  ORF Transcript_48974/g.116463 Transcript_48974/m.116463 type:complete len:471 (+) Transcript_48974:84-1496(+)